MKLYDFLIFKLTFFFAVGILTGYYFSFSLKCILIINGICFFTFCFFYFFYRLTIKENNYFGLFTFIIFFLFGIMTIFFHTHRNQINHYSLLSKDLKVVKLKLHVYKKLKPTKSSNKYLAKVVSINSKATSGIILINTDSSLNVTIDDFFYTTSNLKHIKKPLNPYQFDYKKYMSNQNVYHQVFLNTSNTLKLSSMPSLYGKANYIRNKINNTFINYNVSDKHRSIINALFLGQRQAISKDTYQSFTKSGAIHILAISGLHIGLLMFLLGFLFKPLFHLKHGRVLVPVLIVLFLWCYAFLTGMSASVIRAVTMFSLVSIAIYGNRVANTLHVLVVSFFLLLLYNPFYLFDIGFQLSYLSVFAIVWIKPILDIFWSPKYYIIKKFADIFKITLSVQFGVLPLSLFYFHQFPGLFFISNLVIIPLLGILLCAGLLTIIFAYFGSIPILLLDFLEYSLSLLLSFVDFISSIEMFVISNISFNYVYLMFWYIFIICIVLVLKSFSYNRLVFSLLSIILLQIGFIYNKKQSASSEFIIFNQYKNTLIAEKKGEDLVYRSSSSKRLKPIRDYMVNKFVNILIRDSLQNIYIYKEHKILVVDAKAIYNVSFSPDIILLTDSPKVNLKRLISILKPNLIIADNNNYNSFLEMWKLTCLEESQSFYSIKEKGAFILK
jgi:competence protein ComEC